MTNLLEPTYAVSGVRRYPAPWVLRGSGYILLYKFPKDFAMEEGRIPPFLGTSFAGGLGAVMIVDYAESNAGPYGELLFMPGKFRFGGKRLDCITKIYVSTRESVVNGRENWAIPKERADFDFVAQKNKRTENVVVTRAGEPVIDVTLRHGRVSFPIHTSLILQRNVSPEQRVAATFSSDVRHRRRDYAFDSNESAAARRQRQRPA